jgi:membrane protein YdbS with pleckstrin-like domain
MPDAMRPLHPNHRTLLRIRAGIFAALLILVAAAADALLLRDAPWPRGLVTGIAVLLGLFILLVLPQRRYRSWSWRMDEDELRIASGRIVRSQRVVPFGRVQHIDVVRGPLQRGYGLASLVLHTAGTRSGAITLPGLEAGEAEAMRDHIRGRIREDLA